ncbi:pentatricopeptide repeat-containing protein [Prunus yedoensis var. nudiflora]|uniref:Pentatricopeptide repeat-containing protein n=1 Tax=Prunus yedoensis var. nudiflora TaxID=2094558 RepID=A0A314UMR0_PRUYE|nr:pentatricopeptide repeat-containing protein [Prunus yedoensis var. nudiflora]
MALTSMPIEPDPSALGAFMGACKVHGNLELTKWAAEKLFALEPNKPVNYTLMSNIYSSQGHWGDVSRVRKMMRHSDESHPQAPEVYAMLGLLLRLMKEKSLYL